MVEPNHFWCNALVNQAVLALNSNQASLSFQTATIGAIIAALAYELYFLTYRWIKLPL